MRRLALLIAVVAASACEAPARGVLDAAAGRALAAPDLVLFAGRPAAARANGPEHDEDAGHGAPGAGEIPAFDRPYARRPPSGTSASIGTTRDGYLLGGVPLPTSGPLAARPVSIRRGAIYATRALLAALERAAAAVDRRWPGSVLWAGDASAPSGGDLPGHASHNSGRDVDLAFYWRAADGRLADSPDLARAGADLAAGPGVSFDVARNWALVEALVRDPGVDVQWIFIATPLRAALLAHARDAGADPEVIARAEAVLTQPGDSSPHAEHFHVRVHCGADERLEGCLDATPVRAWAQRRDDELNRLVDGLLPFLDATFSDEFTWAVTRLVRMNATRALAPLRRRLTDPDPRVAALAADAVDFLSGRRTPAAWARWRVPEGALED